MKTRLLAVVLSLVAVSGVAASASDFVDTDLPEKSIGGGLRMGVTTSSINGSMKGYSDNVSYDWGTGFTVGGVVDLNIRNFFTIQPGFFFMNRSHDYTVVVHDRGQQLLQNDLGHTRFYAFDIPVLFSFRFGLADAVQWKCDVGPYFSFGVGGNGNREHIHMQMAQAVGGMNEYVDRVSEYDYYGDGQWQHRKFDWGFKIGTGFRFYDHFVFDIYYLFGCKDVSAYDGWRMRNKTWTFSLGYDF